jgi:hypothetical protein
MIIKIKFLIVLLLIIPLQTIAITGYNYGDTLSNLALSGLKIRSEPGGSNAIGKVPYGEKVIVLPQPWGFADNLLQFETEGIKGNWVKVRYKDISGFVFDGFLTDLPVSDMNCTSLKQYSEACFQRCGPKICYPHNVEGLLERDTLEFFTRKGLYLVYEERYGLETYQEELTIEATCAEDCFLLARNIYKADIDTVITGLRKHPEKSGLTSQKDIEDKIQALTTFHIKDGRVEMALSDDGCYEAIIITQLSSNIFMISRVFAC